MSFQFGFESRESRSGSEFQVRGAAELGTALSSMDSEHICTGHSL